MDTVTVRAVLHTAGMRRMRRESTAALSADRPSVQDLFLGKNTMLAEVVEKLKKTNLQSVVPAGAGDVECDVCTGRKYKAVKSCLVCLNSYCQNHLEQHESFFKGKRHNLTEATGRLQEMICRNMRSSLRFSVALTRMYLLAVFGG